ncbi:MAG: sugar phosphate isomerase/epimerase [Pedosphaera sp.]|nr:sugar phosphate isomerase/epimerase [Pedosphaera sp.]
MQSSRRQFLVASAAGVSAALVPLNPRAAEPGAAASSGFAKPATLKLGLVTYNLAKDWNVPTVIKNCTDAKFDGVELRTSHGHKVEVDLSADQRREVRKRFADSPVQLMGLGSAFDYHTPDLARLRKDIEATKDYLQLSHDVGGTGVKVRPNGLPKEVSVEKTLDQIGRSLRELGQYASGLGQQIRLEVHGEGTSFLPNIHTIMSVANHPQVGVCWNSNQSDLAGEGFDHNFDLVKNRIFSVHMRDLYLEEYPFRRLLTRLNEVGFRGYTMAEISESKDPVRVMRYFRSLWLAYQNLL